MKANTQEPHFHSNSMASRNCKESSRARGLDYGLKILHGHLPPSLERMKAVNLLILLSLICIIIFFLLTHFMDGRDEVTGHRKGDQLQE